MDPKRIEANDVRWLLNAWEMREIESHYTIIANVHKWEEENNIGQRCLDEEEWFKANTAELNWKELNQRVSHICCLINEQWMKSHVRDNCWANVHQTKINNVQRLLLRPAGWIKINDIKCQSLNELVTN